LIKALSLPEQLPQAREGQGGEMKTPAFDTPNPFALPEGPIFVFQRPGQCPAKKLDNQDLEKLRQLLKTMGKNGDSPSVK